MTKAYEIGGPAAQSSLIAPIFRAYYEDDLDISDPDVLADISEQAAIMSRAEVSVPHASRQRSQEMTCISKLFERVMVTELNIGFLDIKLHKFGRVLGHCEPPGIRSSCEGCNWSAIYDNRWQVGRQRWAVSPCVCEGAHDRENRDSFSQTDCVSQIFSKLAEAPGCSPSQLGISPAPQLVY
jgi:hypothetical protein